MNSPGSRSSWLSTALIETDTPGTTAWTCALTRAVTCSRSSRLKGRTSTDMGRPPGEVLPAGSTNVGAISRVALEAATGAARRPSYRASASQRTRRPAHRPSPLPESPGQAWAMPHRRIRSRSRFRRSRAGPAGAAPGVRLPDRASAPPGRSVAARPCRTRAPDERLRIDRKPAALRAQHVAAVKILVEDDSLSL